MQLTKEGYGIIIGRADGSTPLALEAVFGTAVATRYGAVCATPSAGVRSASVSVTVTEERRTSEFRASAPIDALRRVPPYTSNGNDSSSYGHEHQEQIATPIPRLSKYEEPPNQTSTERVDRKTYEDADPKVAQKVNDPGVTCISVGSERG